MTMTKARKPRASKRDGARDLTAWYYEPWMAQYGRKRPHNYDMLLRRYEGWVHHCAWLNATAMSGVQLRLYVLKKRVVSVPTRGVKLAEQRRILKNPQLARKAAGAGDDFDEVESHIALDVLDHPNPYMDGRSFSQIMELHLGLTGNCYQWKERGVLGETVGLWPLPPQYVTIIPGPDRLIGAYELSSDGIRKIRFVPEDIIHLKRPNPRDPYFYGLGEAESEADVIWLSGEIDDYEIHTFKNLARPDSVLEAAKDDAAPLTKDQKDELKKEIALMYGGSKKSGRVAVLSGLRWKPMNWSPRDISYLKGEEKVMLRVANAFGIPKSMLTTDDVNLANAKAGAAQFAARTLEPRLRYTESALTEQWIIEYDERLFVAFDDATPVDEESQYQQEVAYVASGIRTVNEVRADHGWEPLPEPELEPVGETGGNGEDETPPSKQVSQRDHELEHLSSKDFEPAGATSKFAVDLRAEFDKQERELLGSTGKADDDAEAWVARIDARIDTFSPKWAARTEALASAHVTASMVNGAGTAAAVVDVAVDTVFDVTDPGVAKFIDTYTGKLAKRITDTTDERLRSVLKQGIADGSSVPTIENGMREKFAMNKKRSVMIARTETSRAEHAGQKETWKNSGLVTKLVWLASDDPCQYCIALDGETVAIEGNFRELGDKVVAADGTVLDVDFQPIGHPPAHPQCRCSVVPEVIEV